MAGVLLFLYILGGCAGFAYLAWWIVTATLERGRA